MGGGKERDQETKKEGGKVKKKRMANVGREEKTCLLFHDY